MEKPVALGADHGGFALKEAVRAHLDERGVPYVDYGTHSEASVDYPDMAVPPCEAVVRGECACALLFCALCLGGRVVGPGLACELVDLFLDTPFEGGRHAGRVAKISALEQR